VPPRGLSDRDHDVIVIGAGAAGLAAAAALSLAGRSVLTVEARDRIGGRCDTRRLPGVPAPVELGAEFIHGRPEATFSLLKKAGAPAVDTTRTQRLLFGGRLRAVDVFAEARKAMRRKPVTEVSFHKFLSKQKLSPLTDALATMMVQGFDAADPRDASAQAIVE
jgi:phytoene dehydrogenase-like protein